MDSLISIIVPIYNVEKYLKECLESIYTQTFSNFEAILVDDGSIDSSSTICMEYVQKDDRFKYYYKENGGLSDARNFGIEHSNGKYITFLDSDDYLENNYLKVLYATIKTDDSDIAIANYRRIDEFKNVSFDIVPGKNMLLAPEEALKYILYQKYISISVTSKLFKRELFKDIYFPKGKLYEDILTLPKLILSSQKISYISDVVLNYRIRKGSITESKFKNKDFDMLYNSLEILNLIKENKLDNLILPMKSYIFSKSSTLIFLMDKNHLRKSADLKKPWHYIKNYRWNIIFDKNSRYINRLAALTSIFGVNFYILIYNLSKRKH